MTLPTAKPEQYRPAAGAVIFNAQGQVWLGRRASERADCIWQYPQGGIDAGENADHAVLREVHEETGVAPEYMAPLASVKQQLFYDLPTQYKTTTRTKKWRGQRQYWYAFRFLGKDKHFNLSFQDPPEFSTWKWGDLHEAVETVVPFKRDVYARLAKEFSAFAKPVVGSKLY